MEFIVRIFLCLSLFTIAVQCQSKVRTLIVTIVLEEPYTMLRKSNELNLTGNDQYEGFVIDLLNGISTVLDFKYELKINDAIGSFNKTADKWSGAIGEVVEGRTDIAAGPITITSEREVAIDFTVRFMDLGITILYKRPAIRLRSHLITDLLRPFGNFANNFFCVLTVIFGLILLVLRRKYKTIVFRILLGSWVFFLVIFVSIFIAILSSYYVVHGEDYVRETSIRDIAELAEQSEVVYGCVRGGATESFFRYADNSTIYGKMWSHMMANDPSPFVDNNHEGVERVMNGSYAFLAESTFIEYESARNCKVYQIGERLDSKGYGLVLPPGSKIREILNRAIIKLREQGFLSSWKRKWWERDGCLN